jgi:hypothetical protein
MPTDKKFDPEDLIKGKDLDNMSDEDRMELLLQLQEKYTDALDDVYAGFLKKVSAIRKDDDSAKLAKKPEKIASLV